MKPARKFVVAQMLLVGSSLIAVMWCLAVRLKKCTIYTRVSSPGRVGQGCPPIAALEKWFHTGGALSPSVGTLNGGAVAGSDY